MKSTKIYFVIIAILFTACIALFASKTKPGRWKAGRVTSYQTKHYKYEIHTPEAIYFTDSLECGVDGEIGFHNTNGSYIQIK